MRVYEINSYKPDKEGKEIHHFHRVGADSMSEATKYVEDQGSKPYDCGLTMDMWFGSPGIIPEKKIEN